MPMNIRPWNESDEQDCRDGFMAAYDPLIEECPPDYRPVVREVVSAVAGSAFTNMAQYFSDKTAISAWIADSDGQLAGYVDSWLVDPTTGRIGNIYVLPHHRRKGLASRLMCAAEGYLRERDANVVILYSPHPLVEAHQLYLGRGYVLTGTRPSETRREIVTLDFKKAL